MIWLDMKEVHVTYQYHVVYFSMAHSVSHHDGSEPQASSMSGIFACPFQNCWSFDSLLLVKVRTSFPASFQVKYWWEVESETSKLPQRCRHAHSFQILSWNSASWPPIQVFASWSPLQVQVASWSCGSGHNSATRAGSHGQHRAKRAWHSSLSWLETRRLQGQTVIFNFYSKQYQLETVTWISGRFNWARGKTPGPVPVTDLLLCTGFDSEYVVLFLCHIFAQRRMNDRKI